MILDRLASLKSPPSDNPELLRAQYRAFSKQLPMMYFILAASSWALAATHMATAPAWLTVGFPALLTIGCVFRILYWTRSRKLEPPPELVRREFARTNRLAYFFSITFSAWAYCLFPYGDAYAQSHVAFYVAITVIACITCLMHLRSAAFVVTAIVNGSFIVFFTLTGQLTFIAMAINISLVTVGMLIILSINYRDFVSMVDAQTETRRKVEEQNLLLRMFDDMPVAVMRVEPGTFKISYANKPSFDLIRQIEHLLPIKADQLVGTCIDVFHRDPQHQRAILSNPENLPHNTRIRLGPEVIDLNVSAVHADDGSYIGPMLTWALITKEVEAEERIRYLARYDVLTQLPNRTTFEEALRGQLAQPSNQASLLFIDLDGFKLVNDTRGHRSGDALLKQIADRLLDICAGPGAMLGRLGGDEFAVLLAHNQEDQALDLATRIVEALSKPYNIGRDRSIQIGASVGVALSPEHASDSQALLARADIALYAAKAAGKGMAKLFSPDMEHRVQERVQIEAKLRSALQKHEELFVFYQPIVDIQTGRITAREALLRWNLPNRGWVSPGIFIPVAEQSDLIDQLGAFVLATACRDAAGWDDDACVAVNVSAMQLGKGTLVPFLRDILDSTTLRPSRLELEITESALLRDEQDVIGELLQCRDMGLRVALDDFGTGYSSLAYVRAFPFDKIKIDGSFVRDAVDRPDCAAVVRAVVDLGKRLGVTTVAEGVETQAQLDLIREEGCPEVQGYLFGKPMPNEVSA